MEDFTFEPTLTPKALRIQRDGYVEDRLIAVWAESLLVREEEVTIRQEEEDAQLEMEGVAARQVRC